MFTICSLDNLLTFGCLLFLRYVGSNRIEMKLCRTLAFFYSIPPPVRGSTCTSPLGERVSGDGAEFPDEPELMEPYTKLSAITEKYTQLWSTSVVKDPEQRQLSRNYKLGAVFSSLSPRLCRNGAISRSY
eukprot:sb/3475127/